MEEERRRKIEAGREKLAAYRKRKSGEKKSDSEHSSLTFSDTSLSLSPLPLSETANKLPTVVTGQVNANSGSSSISENIELSNSENDRSLQEMVFANIPLDSPGVVPQQQPRRQPARSLNASLISDSSVISLNALEKFELDNNNDFDGSPNILNEIIRHEAFSNNSDSLRSNALDDLSSITLKSERVTDGRGCEHNTSQDVLVTNEVDCRVNDEPVHREQQFQTQLSTESDSLKEVNSSNPSTLSLGTSTTEYKHYFDKINLGAIEFQDVLSHRDDHIKQLTDALQQVLEDRNHLQEQTDYFAQEIADLREQLVQTTAIIKKNNWNTTFGNEPVSGNFRNDGQSKEIQKAQVSQTNAMQNSLPSVTVDDNFDFEDSELNETLSAEEKKILADMRIKINLFIQQKLQEYRTVYESEIKILKDQLQQETDSKNKQSLENKESQERKDNKNLTSKVDEFDDPMFNETFSPEEQNIIADMRSKIYMFIQQKLQSYKLELQLEFKILQDRFENEKSLHQTEVERLRQLVMTVKSGSTDVTDLRQELNEQHNKEMEELRTYFEQRCADIEKHYSEEIFSQQSRKMSGSSVGSELESEIYPPPATGPGGDTSAVVADAVRLELQNKYHAELEILREDYDNRLDELKIKHDTLEEKYVNQIELLKSELEEAQKNAVTSQEVASSGDFEIAEVVESYERRLQEQVMLAKTDIISALEQQIQTVVSSQSEDLDCPSMLVVLGERLTEPKIRELKEQHAEELTRVREEHEKILARALDRERRNSLKSAEDADIRKERDKLKKLTSHLRHLVAELLKYFTKCEDELNNTIVEELLKYGFDKDLSKVESDFNDSSHDGSEHFDALTISPRVKRVHFTPDVSGIINLINETSLENIDNTKDISSEFRTELDLCLERLKTEANAILALTLNLKVKPIEAITADDAKPLAIEDKLSSLTRQLIAETQAKNELNIQLEESRNYSQNLEIEKHSLETQLEQMMAKQQVLVLELDHAKEKITDLIESGRKEIVSEGYGENQITGSTTLGGRIASLADLQDRARMILAEADPTVEHPLIQLVEELCREGDRIMEDAKKDHEDLVQQIEAADKKLRATTQFLEDQAVDRELERDEAQKEIAALKEQLRDTERTRASCERINREETLNVCSCDFGSTVMDTVERLEVQMREMTALMAECESKKTDVENELKEAIDKIWVLRDIIIDLEKQIEDKTKTEVELKNIVTQLEDKIREEAKQNAEFNQQIEALKCCAEENQYNEIIRKLESEIQKLRVSSELVGPDGVLKQVKTQLNEFEKTVEKRTKDLESLHIVVSNTNCSSPSEDMSLRDQIRPQSSNDADSDLPLEQLARLKDKLIRHARAEDAAMKRIRDLEMQLYTCKQDYDEMQSERDVLQDQLSEQMVLISSLQLRLDEQRLRVESVQKQTNTSLEHKIYELENEVQELKESIHSRDKNIKQLTTIVDQTKKRLAEQQKQLNSASDIEKEIVEQLQTEINRLKSENESLRSKYQNDITQIQNENASNQSLKNNQTNAGLSSEFLDSMLADKNADIDRLKLRLNDIEQELHFYSSLNLTKEQLLHLSHSVSGQKSSDIVSLIETSEPDQMRRQEVSFDSIHSNENLEFKRNVNETMFIGSTFRDSKYPGKAHSPFLVPELSTIEKVGPSCVNYTVEENQLKQAAEVDTGDSVKSHKHVHFEDNFEVSRLESKITDLQHDLDNKNDTIKSYELKLASLSDYTIDIENLRKKLEFSEETLKENTENFKDEIDSLKEAEKNLRVEMAEIKMELQQKINKLEALEKDVARKDQMYMNLAKEKRDLENKIRDLETKYGEFAKFEGILADKNKEIYNLERQLAEASEIVSSESLKESILQKESEVNFLKEEISNMEFKLEEKISQLDKAKGDYDSAKRELSEKKEMLLKNDKEQKNILSQCNELSTHVAQLKQILGERNETVQRLEQDLEKEQQQNAKLREYESKIHELEANLNAFKTKLESTRIEDSKLSVSNLELEIARNKKELAEKELQLTKDKTVIEELTKEVHHLQEFLSEKDKIINQMTVDSNSLHVALEAIQSKIQESGNVVDLKKRLREEQNLTAALHEELKYLKKGIDQYEYTESSNVTETLVLLKQSVEREKMINQELTNTKEALLLEVQQLKQRLHAEEESVKKLQHSLEEEKQNSNKVQIEDASIIESMRHRLEALLDNENETERLLKSEKKTREELEKQIITLTQRTGSVSLESNFKINDANFEVTCIKMDLVKVTTENEILKSELNTLKNRHAVIKNQLTQAREVNNAQNVELEDLKKLLNNSKEKEELHKRTKREVEQRSLEAESTKLLMKEIEEDKKLMRRQIEELQDSLRKVKESEVELNQLLMMERHKQLDSPVPEKFLQKMKELTSLLQTHIADNKQMTSTVVHLTDERRSLQSRVKELEDRLNIKPPYDDPVSRADHLFGRYLKSESYRKALVFQKRYLLTLLASYQKCTSVNLAELNFVLPSLHSSRGLNKFRIAVYAIISIRRMQYIVQRWHTGKRIGSSVVLKRPIVSPVGGARPVTPTQSRDVRPWSGNSPPCKDRTTNRRTAMPLGNTIQESITLAPLQTPALLSQYVQRFENIQQRLGLALDRGSAT